MGKIQRNLWFLATTIFAVYLVTYALSGIVKQPWHEIPELGGDGAKNIFTYLYQSTQGSGYWFSGMNYPYGEHIVYTDGQPVLSVLLSSIKGVTIGQALSILWWLIGLSYVVSILFLYKILTRFKLAPLAALLFAGLIGIFTPQMLKLQGHYALSYTCIIPMLFYWTILYTDRPHWRYCIYFFILGCIAAFIHPYYAAMMLVWVFAFAAGFILFTRQPFMHKLKIAAPLVISVIMVLGVVALVMKLTDPVTDRPVTPFNTLYETCTRLKQLVTSFNSPVWKPLLHTRFFYRISDGGEGYAYMGVVTIFTIGLFLLAILVKSFRQKKAATDLGTGFSPVWLFLAFSTLLFGMGIPFIWHIEWMSYLSVFKQFRSLGRFSWIFYYIISVYSAVVIYTAYSRLLASGKTVAAYAVITAALAIWTWEASGYVEYSRRLAKSGSYNYDMMFSTHEQNWEGFLGDHQYKKSDFQALLLLPYFHVGTEKLWVGYGNWLITLGSKASLQLHLPMVNVMMSRSSWGQAEKQVKIAAGPFASKPLLKDISSNRPFLLLCFDEDTLNEDQKYLLTASDYLGHYSQCYVYACYPDRIATHDKKMADSVNRILPFMHRPDTVIDGNGNYYTNHCDNVPSSFHLFGTGCMPAIAQDSAIIATIPIISPPKDSELYEFSCWFLLHNDDPRAPNFSLELMDGSGRNVTTADVLTRQSTDNKGMWFRAGKYFYIYHNTHEIHCKIMNVPNPSYIALDELLLRPANALVISKSADGQVMANNHLVGTR